MTGKSETRVRKIRSRTRQYRRQHENRVLFSLAAFSLFLLAGIGGVFKSAQTPGIAAVADGYGAVLLRDGAVTSVLVGASRPEQVLEDLKVLQSPAFTEEELRLIDGIC